MTAANDNSFTPKAEGSSASSTPENSTAMQPGSPPSAEAKIPLPPIEAPLEEPITPEELAQETARLDGVLSIFVLVLAFLLASFLVRNTDFFMHLAQGRLYAHGHFNFGADPFSYSKTNYWTNSAWLYDLILYGITAVSGGLEGPAAGVVLVVLKGLLVVLLAWFMLNTSRPDLPRWAPALCTALALVALSPRLLYQPTLLSFLFLGITLYILQRPRHEAFGRNESSEQSPLRIYWILPLLFVLWVNLDAWWFLGPVTVALFLLGQALQRLFAPLRTGVDASEPGHLATLVGVLVAGVAAGLVNPHHYHAFTLPAIISPTTPVDVLREDSIFRSQFDMPLGGPPTLQPTTVAGIAYFVLLGLGLLSFGLSLMGEWRWWRFTIWLAFAALSAYRMRTIPFFAVVAGPITALNLQGFALVSFGRLPRVDRSWRAFALGGRVLTLLAALVVILAAWPGWLHSRPTALVEGHRVGWGIHIDPSLRATAQKLRAWHEQGVLKADENGFNFTPDVANYCAWYGADERSGMPAEKSYFDYRLELYPADVARFYMDFRLEMVMLTGDPTTRSLDWQDTFRKQHITHVVLNNNDDNFRYVWPGMLHDWSQWALVDVVEGRTLIFRWNDPLKRAQASALPRLDLNTLAFGPAPMQAPKEGITTSPQPQDMFARFLHGPIMPPPQHDEASVFLTYFDLIYPSWFPPFLAAADFGKWSATVAAAGQAPGVGAIDSHGTLLLHTVPVTAALGGSPVAVQLLLQGKDWGPAAAPVLAVRAARKGIAQSPNYFGNYLRIAEAYSDLWRFQEEHWTQQPQGSPARYPREQLRAIQTAVALEQAVRLRPSDFRPHEMLFKLYYQLNYRDLALQHLQEVARLRPPQPGENPETFRKIIESLDKMVKELEEEVRTAGYQFDLDATNKPVRDKVRLALSRRLGKKALEVLLQAPPAEIDQEGLERMIYLLLTTGASHSSLQNGLDDVRKLLDDVKLQLGQSYERYAFFLEAATGNYAKADEYIAEAIHKLELTCEHGVLTALRNEVFTGSNLEFFAQTNFLLQNLMLVADSKVLRAMVALEAGDVAAVARHCEDALNMNNGQPPLFESKMIAVNYLRLIKAAGGAK